MMMIRTRSLLVLLLLSIQCWTAFGSPASTIAFDRDLDDNCADKLDDCTKDPSIWNTCSISCAKSLEPARAIDFASVKGDAFLDLTATDHKGKTIRFENFDGYVTLVATVPKVMVPFYYEALEHLQSVYPYVLEILMVPLEETELQTHKDGRVIVLKEATDVLKFFKDLGKEASDKYVTGYLLSVDGDLLQIHHSPNMETLKEHARKDMIELEKHEPEF